MREMGLTERQADEIVYDRNALMDFVRGCARGLLPSKKSTDNMLQHMWHPIYDTSLVLNFV